jgi:hypothetical protein
MSKQKNIDSLYADSFNRFLNATNEKDAFVEALSHNALKSGDTLLDIGAGNGELAGKIIERHQPSKYVGIELNKAFHDPLAALGLEVIPESYPNADPLLGDSRFGTVLTSYSVPLTNPGRIDFVQHAFERTRSSDGTMAIVSFAGQDQWSTIAAEINELIGDAIPSDEPAGQPTVEDFTEALKEEYADLGYIDARIFTSEIRGESVDDLFHSIAFIATAGMKSALKQYYQSKQAITETLKAHAPSGSIAQSHSLVTISRKSPRAN